MLAEDDVGDAVAEDESSAEETLLSLSATKKPPHVIHCFYFFSSPSRQIKMMITAKCRHT